MFIDICRIPATGEPRIDQGHRDLADMVNTLFEQWRSGLDGVELRAGFERFLRAVGRHFAEEEAIITAAGCADVPEHVGKHNALMAALTAHVHALADPEDVRAGDRRIDLFTLIDQMLYDHEMLDDLDFWPVFRAAGPKPLALSGGPLIEWSLELETGHGELDRQHRTLIDLVNGLDAMLRGDASATEARELLDQIVHYTRCHFQWEERIMAGIQAPGAETHRLLHAQLLEELADMVEAAGGQPTADLVRCLKFWFIDHVRYVDADLARVLTANGAESARRSRDQQEPLGCSRPPEVSAS